jgi:uncharacterized membrane protein YphA (DoxX/SURF4 family)
MPPMQNPSLQPATLFVRYALAAGFLSAVADRVGLWGGPGTSGVVWGNMPAFLDYTRQLLWFLPVGLANIAGGIATALEVVLALGLLFGIALRVVAISSGVLLLLFALAMTAASGAEAALSYSVWTAASAAFLLASVGTRQSRVRF